MGAFTPKNNQYLYGHGNSISQNEYPQLPRKKCGLPLRTKAQGSCGQLLVELYD